MSATLYRRWFDEVWNQGREGAIDELFAPAGRSHGLAGTLTGPDGFRAFRAGLLDLFPSVRVEVHDVVEGPPAADGSVTVAGRFTAHLVSRQGQPAAMSCMSFGRWRDGQLVEAWDVCDFRGVEKQVGALPF